MSNTLKQLSHYAKNYYHNKKSSALISCSNTNTSTVVPLYTLYKRCKDAALWGFCIILSGSHCPWTRQCLRNYMAGRCGRTAQSTTRCRISIARCRYQPIVQCILQRAVDNRQPHTLVITTRCLVAINKITSLVL